MKKISILMLHLKHGGIEKQTISMANMLSKYFAVEIISLYNYDNFIAYSVDPKVKIRYLLNYGSNRKEFKEAIKKKKIGLIIKEGILALKVLFNKNRTMKKYIKETDADILFSTRIEFANLITKYNKKKIITITQEHNHIDNLKYQNEVKCATRGIDYLVVMSEIAYNLYSKWTEENKTKIIIIPNILDCVPENSSKLNTNNLIAVGRLHPVKNYRALIEVFKLVNYIDDKITLTIVGDGEEKKTLMEIVADYHLSDKVIFTGMVSAKEVEQNMLNSDLFIMTSITECFPMVLLEANSCGVPVISFDIPAGPQTIIKETQNGFLITNNDYKLMANKIIEYMNDEKVKKNMGHFSKKYAEQFLGESILPKWLELLKGENE